MGSESHLCGWHLPPIEAPKVVETGPKIKCTPRHVMNKMKYKTELHESEQFRHFTDAGRYIDEYRRNHTVASGAMEWGGNKVVDKTTESAIEDERFSKYIDIRVPEKKICLTGLPQLRPPPKHVIRTRALHEAGEERPFLGGVPHLPHLTLKGATKNVVKRQLKKNEEQKRTHRKKKQGRLPYLQPPKVEL